MNQFINRFNRDFGIHHNTCSVRLRFRLHFLERHGEEQKTTSFYSAAKCCCLIDCRSEMFGGALSTHDVRLLQDSPGATTPRQTLGQDISMRIHENNARYLLSDSL